jgi:ribonuclease HI
MLPKIKTKTNITNNAKIFPELDYLLRFDGCSKGNPGKAGCGAVIYHDGDEIWSDHFYVGLNATNNHAEYAGLILGLQKALQLKIDSLLVEGDSQLVIQQMNKVYKCKSSNLFELYERATDLSSKFKTIHFNHIYRNQNKRADELSNIAILDNEAITDIDEIDEIDEIDDDDKIY